MRITSGIDIRPKRSRSLSTTRPLFARLVKPPLPTPVARSSVAACPEAEDHTHVSGEDQRRSFPPLRRSVDLRGPGYRPSSL